MISLDMKMRLRSQIILFTLVGCTFFVAGNVLATENVKHKVNVTPEGKREYGNILIVWEPSITEVSVNVTITMGTALIGSMNFTPDTLRQSLNYSNPPQSATGIFLIEFNATGQEGKLYVENLKWVTRSSEGNVTSLIGIWSVNKVGE